MDSGGAAPPSGASGPSSLYANAPPSSKAASLSLSRARHSPLSVHTETLPSTSAPSSPRDAKPSQARTRFELELDLASKRQQHADTQADVAQLETMQATLAAQESTADERIAAANRELERYRKQHMASAEAPTYMLPQGDFRRITSPNPDSDRLASGEEWMSQPHVQRLLRVKEEERAKVADLRRQIQTKVLDLRQRQHDQPGDMSFDDKLAYFVTAAAPLNEQLEEEYKTKRGGPAHPPAHVAEAMNVKYDQTNC